MAAASVAEGKLEILPASQAFVFFQKKSFL
jgi:hypothetical protein